VNSCRARGHSGEGGKIRQSSFFNTFFAPFVFSSPHRGSPQFLSARKRGDGRKREHHICLRIRILVEKRRASAKGKT